MLKYLREQDHRLTLQTERDQTCISNAVLGSSLKNYIDMANRRIDRTQLDFKAFLGKEGLLNGRVVSGELELVEPLQLDRDAFLRARHAM